MLKGFVARAIENHFILLIGQLLVLLICLIYINHFYYENIYPDKRAKEVFQQASCLLLNKTLNSQKMGDDYRYRIDFLVRYTVNNRQYTRIVSGNGLNVLFTERREPKEEMMSRYAIGNSYTCWYDPENPSIAILVMRHYWFSTFPLIFPSIIAVIVFYFFIINFLDVLSDVIMRFRKK